MSFVQKSESTALQSDLRPIPASGTSLSTIHIVGVPNVNDAHRSGNINTTVAANSGAFGPAGMITVNISGSLKHIAYFNP